MKHKCGYDDCFSCPFHDCIVNGVDSADPKTSDFLVIKTRLTEDQKKEKHKEYSRTRYYLKKEEYKRKPHK